jgi:N-carbamoyl-L-amino-acid hydrolase
VRARCSGALRAGAVAAGLDSLDLHSGAAHDSMHVARLTDAGMLFAPSRDGASHSPREWTDWADCAAGTRVLANALAQLAA